MVGEGMEAIGGWVESQRREDAKSRGEVRQVLVSGAFLKREDGRRYVLEKDCLTTDDTEGADVGGEGWS